MTSAPDPCFWLRIGVRGWAWLRSEGLGLPARVGLVDPRCVYDVCMARMNVYVPDELAERVKKADLNVSALVQSALADALQRRATDSWLDELPAPRQKVSHDAAMDALAAARSEFGDGADA